MRVFYDGGDCGSEAIEIEVFDRKRETWRAHPQHPRVPVPSCQVEDAGRLFNELRWRCFLPEAAEFPPAWRPFAVFDPEVMSRCAVEPLDTDARRTAISVRSPAEGVPVRAPEPVVTLIGNVVIDGLDGSDYDVVLLIDRSAPGDALAAQVTAARDFVRSLIPRLGAVRVAVISYPNRSSASGESTGARRELAWSDDPLVIDRALASLPAQPVASGLPTVSEALSEALVLLESARPAARPIFVMNADGALLDSAREPAPDHPLLRAAARAGARGAVLHWVALGGVAAADPPLVRSALEAGRATFRRVPPHRYGTSFLSDVALPVAEAVWIEREGGGKTIPAALDAHGSFVARVPVEGGSNRLLIRARISDGAEVLRPFALIFDDTMLPEVVLEEERARIREAQRKRLEIRPERDVETSDP